MNVPSCPPNYSCTWNQYPHLPFEPAPWIVAFGAIIILIAVVGVLLLIDNWIEYKKGVK